MSPSDIREISSACERFRTALLNLDEMVDIYSSNQDASDDSSPGFTPLLEYCSKEDEAVTKCASRIIAAAKAWSIECPELMSVLREPDLRETYRLFDQPRPKAELRMIAERARKELVDPTPRVLGSKLCDDFIASVKELDELADTIANGDLNYGNLKAAEEGFDDERRKCQEIGASLIAEFYPDHSDNNPILIFIRSIADGFFRTERADAAREIAWYIRVRALIDESKQKVAVEKTATSGEGWDAFEVQDAARALSSAIDQLDDFADNGHVSGDENGDVYLQQLHAAFAILKPFVEAFDLPFDTVTKLCALADPIDANWDDDEFGLTLSSEISKVVRVSSNLIAKSIASDSDKIKDFATEFEKDHGDIPTMQEWRPKANGTFGIERVPRSDEVEHHSEAVGSAGPLLNTTLPPLRVDPAKREAWIGDAKIGINAGADFTILHCLAIAKGKVVPHREMAEALSPGSVAAGVTLNEPRSEVKDALKHIRAAVKGLHSSAGDPIQLVRMKGYYLKWPYSEGNEV